jgi:hypothetical protein
MDQEDLTEADMGPFGGEDVARLAQTLPAQRHLAHVALSVVSTQALLLGPLLGAWATEIGAKACAPWQMAIPLILCAASAAFSSRSTVNTGRNKAWERPLVFWSLLVANSASGVLCFAGFAGGAKRGQEFSFQQAPHDSALSQTPPLSSPLPPPEKQNRQEPRVFASGRGAARHDGGRRDDRSGPRRGVRAARAAYRHIRQRAFFCSLVALRLCWLL